MDIEEAKEYFRNCLDEEYNYKNATRNKDKKAIEILLNELDKNSNIISDLQNEVTLKQSELDKNNKIIDKLLTEITAVNSGRYEYMDNNRVLEIFTNKVAEDK